MLLLIKCIYLFIIIICRLILVLKERKPETERPYISVVFRKCYFFFSLSSLLVQLNCYLPDYSVTYQAIALLIRLWCYLSGDSVSYKIIVLLINHSVNYQVIVINVTYQTALLLIKLLTRTSSQCSRFIRVITTMINSITGEASIYTEVSTLTPEVRTGSF